MIILRSALKRGQSQLNWLKSYHTFSFADYYDENWIRFGFLRVINEDYIQPRQGFGLHPHRDMEIITYVIQGELEHKDSMENGSVIRAGEIQRMTAGIGVTHSEFNHSNTDELHLLQIWILPQQKSLIPSYEQKQIPKKNNQLFLIGSNQPTEHAVTIHQNIQLYVGYFEKNEAFLYSLNKNRAWLQLIKGTILINGVKLNAGDGIGIQNEEQLRFKFLENAEFLFFEMPSF